MLYPKGRLFTQGLSESRVKVEGLYLFNVTNIYRINQESAFYYRTLVQITKNSPSFIMLAKAI